MLFLPDISGGCRISYPTYLAGLVSLLRTVSEPERLAEQYSIIPSVPDPERPG